VKNFDVARLLDGIYGLRAAQIRGVPGLGVCTAARFVAAIAGIAASKKRGLRLLDRLGIRRSARIT
jgi:hypothetical protein